MDCHFRVTLVLNSSRRVGAGSAAQCRSIFQTKLSILDNAMTRVAEQNRFAEGLSDEAIELLSIREAVFDRWEAGARDQIEGAAELLAPALTDNFPYLYNNLAEAISPSMARQTATENTTAAQSHGNERARLTRFGPDEVLREYQLFRDAIRDVAHESGARWSPETWATIGRSIEIAARESLREYAATHEALRRRVAATLSHDMRAPLSVIATGLQLIALSNDLGAAKLFSKKIEHQTKRLDEMIGELLDALTAMPQETRPLAVSRFDMYALASEVASQFTAVGTTALTIAGESVEGHWCAAAIRRALENLLTNAIKHGTPGGEIAIAVHQERGRVSVSVHNFGRAIPAERREQIFGYLARDVGPDVAGWGIGLPSAQSIVEAHGGNILVDSSDDAGTTFTIDAPVDCRPFVKSPVALSPLPR